MIAQITGKLIAKKPPMLVLETQGLGYEIMAPMETFYHLPELNEMVTLHTHLAIREDAHTLYGFHSDATKALFKKLIKINGVGPKVALAILSGITPSQFVACIEAQDHKLLTKIPGVGPKMAQRLTLELKDKLDDWAAASDVALTAAITSDSIQEANDALIALGYKPQDAKRMLKNANATDSAETLIRQALSSVSA